MPPLVKGLKNEVNPTVLCIVCAYMPPVVKGLRNPTVLCIVYAYMPPVVKGLNNEVYPLPTIGNRLKKQKGLYEVFNA